MVMNDRVNNFEYAFGNTFELEKGYHPGSDADPETNDGITIDVFNEAVRRGIVPDRGGLKALTHEDNKTICRIMYWMEHRLGELNDREIAAEVYDTIFNAGPGAGTRIAQKACNWLGEDLKEDGVMGLATLEALNRWSAKDPRALFKSLNGFQFIHFVAVSSRNPKKRIFNRGWMKRIQDYREEKRISMQAPGQPN
jgi:lysozyme family protein